MNQRLAAGAGAADMPLSCASHADQSTGPVSNRFCKLPNTLPQALSK